MASLVVPKVSVLRRFTYWTVSPSNANPGSCDVVLIREVVGELKLSKEERQELDEVIIGEILYMYQTAIGECDSYSSWDGKTYNVRALNKDRTELSEKTARELFQALLQAAAAFAA